MKLFAFAPLVARPARLICTSEEFAGLWNEAFRGTPGPGVSGSGGPPEEGAAKRAILDPPPGLPRTWTPACGATQTAHRTRLRAELDGLIAHLYELTEEEFAHILTTFPLVSDQVKSAARTAYRDVKLGVIQ